MRIKEILKKDIKRNINGVVKAENNREETIINELEEYVITEEVRKHMGKLFDRYSDSLNNRTEDMGIWISGFFGSGKSHLLKMLGHIVANKEYNGKRTTDYFEDKLEDEILKGNLNRSSAKETDVILFNIDNVSDQDTNQNKDSIVLAFQKKFNEYLGFSRDDIKVASLERRFWELGIFEEFKELFQEVSGDSWESSRRNMHFISDDFLDTIEELEIKGFSRNAAERWLEEDKEESVNPESFCDYLESYLKLKGKEHRILFLVDEIGQYIGDNTTLMLNLQTIVENLGVRFNGRVWVGVTSQQNIEEILKESNTKRVDFAKIQGRFKTMLSLSSSNIDEVIKKRLLEKREIEKEELENLYEKRRIDIENLITFSKEGVTQKIYDDKFDFAGAYPFVGYQFNLLQKVLDKVRNMGHSGKHMSRGERSLLSSFQEAGIKMGEKEVGSLVPFHYFYESIEQFLEDNVRRPFVQAKNEKGCTDFEIDVLKLLFLLKGIDDTVAPTLENLTSFMIDNIDCNKIELEAKIKKALRKLEKEFLIQRDANKYYFLTNEEQDINREIGQEDVEVKEKYRSLDNYIFDDIFDEKSITVPDTGNKYQFNRMIDEEKFGNHTGQLDLVIFTPSADGYNKENLIGGRDEYDLIIKLPEDIEFFSEINLAIKVDNYLKKNRTTTRENVQRIIESKQRENMARKKRITHQLEEAIKKAKVYIKGHEMEIVGKDAGKKIENSLKAVANVRFKDASLIRKKYDIKRIEDILETTFEVENQLININKSIEYNPNKEAINEVKKRVKLQKERGNKLTAKDLVDYYSTKPYGWDSMTINGIIAELWIHKLINIDESGERIETSMEARKYLIKTQSKTLEKLVIQPKEEVDIELLRKVNNVIKELWGAALEITVNDPKKELDNIISGKRKDVRTELNEYKKNKLPGKKILEEWEELLLEVLNIRGNGEKALKEFIKLSEDLKEEYDNYERVKDFINGEKKDTYLRGQEKLEVIEQYQDYIGEVKENEAYYNLKKVIDSKNPYSKIRLINDYIEEIEKEESKIISAEVKKLESKADEELELGKIKFSTTPELLKSLSDELERFKEEILKEKNVQVTTRGKKLENIIKKAEEEYREVKIKELKTFEREVLTSLVGKDNTVDLENRVKKEFKILREKIKSSSIKEILGLVESGRRDKEGFIKEGEGKSKKKERTSIKKLKVETAYNLETKEEIDKYFEKLEKEMEALKEKALKSIEEKKIIDIK